MTDIKITPKSLRECRRLSCLNCTGWYDNKLDLYIFVAKCQIRQDLIRWEEKNDTDKN